MGWFDSMFAAQPQQPYSMFNDPRLQEPSRGQKWLGIAGAAAKDLAQMHSPEGGQGTGFSDLRDQQAQRQMMQQQQAQQQAVAPLMQQMMPRLGPEGAKAFQAYMAAGGNPMEFMKMVPAAPKYSTTPQSGINPKTGKAGTYVQGENGETQWLDVEPRDRMEMAPSGVTYNPMDTPAGTAFNDPNKAFGIGQNGGLAPNMPFQNYEIDKAQAGRSQTNVNMPGQQRAFDVAVGEVQGGRYKNYIDAADAARNKINMLDTLGGALGDAPFAGPLAGMLTSGALLAKQLGLSDADTSGAEIARGLSNQMAMMERNPAGGAGMPGAMSDADRKFLSETVPGLRNSRGGAQKMVQMAKAMEQRKIEVADLAQQYVEKNGKLDSGFDTALKQYADSRPIFAGGAANAPTGGPEKWERDPATGRLRRAQ